VEASGYLRDHSIWAAATEANITKAEPPPQQSAYEAAAEKAAYASKYSTKPDNINLATAAVTQSLPKQKAPFRPGLLLPRHQKTNLQSTS
jgi:hypothetical protein